MQNLISLAIICPGVIGITTKYYIASQVYLHQSITCVVDKGLFTSFSSICVNDTQADDIEYTVSFERVSYTYFVGLWHISL